MVRGGRREEGSEWGTHIYLWQIHGDIWQNQYNIVKLKKKKNLPAMQEMWVQSPCWDNPLEEEMAGHFSSFAWMIPWTEEPDKLQSMGSQKSQTQLRKTNFIFFYFFFNFTILYWFCHISK